MVVECSTYIFGSTLKHRWDIDMDDTDTHTYRQTQIMLVAIFRGMVLIRTFEGRKRAQLSARIQITP